MIKEKTLYDNKIKVEFEDDPTGRLSTHKYKIYDLVTGEKLKPTSVTSYLNIIAKPQLKFWAVKLAKEYLANILKSNGKITDEDIEIAGKQHTLFLKKAGNIGTDVHEWIAMYISGLDPEIPTGVDNQKVRNGIEGFLKWVEEEEIEFLESEFFVYSKKHNIVGTCDTLAKIRGEIRVVDFKTSSGIYSGALMQVSAYTEFVIEEGSLIEKYKIKKLGQPIVVNFKKNDSDDGLDKAGDFSFVKVDDYKKQFKGYLHTKGLTEIEKSNTKYLKSLVSKK